MKFKSIKTKVLLTLIITTVLIFSIITILSNNRISNQLEKDAESSLLKDSEIISKEINVFFQKYGMLVRQMSKNPDIINIVKDYKNRSSKRTHPEFEKIVNILQDIKSTDENLALVWLGSDAADDLITDIYNYDAAADFDISERGWYVQMVGNDGLTYTDPYVDAVTGNLVISIVEPVYDGDKIIGNVGIDLMINDISKFMSNYKIGENGYSILVTASGTVVYHVDENEIMNTNITEKEGKLGEIGTDMISGKQGIDSYTYNGEEKYFAYSPIEAGNWSVGVNVPKSESQKAIQSFTFFNIIIFFIAILILIVIIYFIINKSLKHIPTIVEKLNSFSNGDLTTKIDVMDRLYLIGQNP
jgi:methyl-accepting chemotaxis protein